MKKNGYWLINGKKIFIDINETNKDFLYIAFKFGYSEEDIFWD